MDAAEREQLLATVARDTTIDLTHRLRAIDMLNRCAGAYSMTHVVKSKLTLEEAIAASRRLPDGPEAGR